jgi:hypothetical protein
MSDELYLRRFALLGFEILSVSQNQYVCNALARQVWTFVARRSRQ